MARAAVIPPSPANRAGRTSTKSTAATDAKKKLIRKATPTTRAATTPTNFDSDDTEDELGFVAAKPAKPRGRPPGRSAVKPKATIRGKKAAPEPVTEEPNVNEADEVGQQTEAPKKRPGRPRKNQTMIEAPVGKQETVPKPRGRPRAGTPAKPSATRGTAASNRRTRGATEDPEEKKPNQITIATNSTTMRSNLLRGPAKKKTVTFQDTSDSEEEEPSAPTPPAAGRKKVATKATGAGKTGLKATPVRKPATTAARGRKPAGPKKAATKPLSPKKTKQMANTLSAYTSSDGEEDELNTLRDDIKSPVRLVVHSPAKHGLETTGLSSPVRRINFTPKKASNYVDENGEPKLPTPKQGSEGAGLNSPVRRINFTPNRSQTTVADNDHLALPPGRAIDFSDSIFMCSPARRPPPTSSPFKFSLRDSQRGGSLFRDSANQTGAADFTPGHASPLKSSPKKGNLGASFSQSPFKKSTPAIPARTPLFQSPAKRMASPLKSSIFSTGASVVQSPATSEQGTFSKPLETERTTPKYSPRAEEQDQIAVDRDSEMVEDVARDIFGIELSFEKTPSESPLKAEKLGSEAVEETNHDEVDAVSTEIDVEGDSGSEEAENPQDQLSYEYEEPETVCFDAMEEAELETGDLYDEEMQEDSGSEQDEDPQAQVQFEYEEADTVCFDAMEDAEVDAYESHNEQVQVTEIALEDERSLHEEESAPEDQTEEEEIEGRIAPVSPDSISESAQAPEFSDEAPSPSKLVSDLAHTEDVEILDVQEEEGAPSIISNFDEEQQLTGQEAQTEDTDYSPIRPFVFDLSSPEPISPSEASEGNVVGSPLQRMYATPSPASMPPVGSFTPPTSDRLDNTENDDPTPHARNANVGMPLGEISGPSPSVQADSPTLMAPSLFNTPSLADHRQSPLDAGLGFTPLAQKFDRWETNTPSQRRSLRPRRRGVFSLVGPLDLTKAETPVQPGAVSYPDLSKSPLANSPSLFAELPLQPQSEGTCISPEQDQTPRPSSIYEDDGLIQSRSKDTEIFEDPDMDILEDDNQEKTPRKERMPATEPQFQEQEHLDEDKENFNSNILPATPMKVQPEAMRTVHTVSKVPLKAEGEVSPIKVSRKRGLSLSNMSPTRSSPRVRKPTFRPPEENVLLLSPTRRHSRANRTPSPKRRSSTARRSSGKPAVITSTGEHVATQSPAKKSRSSMSTSQKALHGAVVHVDVHTTEGEDASGIFVELLQQMGARCVKSWSWNPASSHPDVDGAELKESRVGITHVVYKDGGLRTLEKVKKARGLVKCVGVGWVLDCERENQWLDETPYAVDSSIIPRGGAKRRKSMEPRALSNVNGTLIRIPESPAPSASGRRSGADQGAVDGFRKITPPTHQQEAPSTPTRQSSTDDYQFPATPGYNFANLDAIGMSPATPYFLSNRSKLVQQSCPPKQSNRGLFPGAKPSSILEDEDDDDSRRKQRFRMEAARRKSLVHKPAVASPLRR
ncbi:hypothetical protein PENANT_c028G10836 [Penicillium antarcticum]|uniref:BRCT domain-containing protein n=1 Tax=Penicillium antarcticum TaxID=416450 RepID=A0A1V6PWB7_9EURO|nr:uncharacterized protein N7508_009018 [Penicillium antarcticum]KAJ5294197.1 hypothetical protein N7508_009018 [Penicillium antarcticum]OQD81319.1 hypothetical protein PENANT_c028G10836 [Penicillium antarcticum]